MKKKFDVKKALIIIAAVIILWPLLRTVFTIGAIVAMAIFVYLLVTGRQSNDDKDYGTVRYGMYALYE